MAEKRQAKFIGNLFINTAKESGKTYGRGTLVIDDKEIEVFGHFRVTKSKDGSKDINVFHLEDITEQELVKKASDIKLDKGAKKTKAFDIAEF